MSEAKKRNTKQKESINISLNLLKSQQGKCFIGQTDYMTIGQGLSGCGSLVNPNNSQVNLLISKFSVANFSDIPLTVQIWMNGNCIEKGNISGNFSATNRTSSSSPFAQIHYTQTFIKSPVSGINIFTFQVPSNDTKCFNTDGIFIIPPEESFLVYILPNPSKLIKTSVSFEWWEESIIN